MGLFTPKDFEYPQWEVKDKVHCWRNYASESLRALWPTFSSLQKSIIAENLQSIADDEDWE